MLLATQTQHVRDRTDDAIQGYFETYSLWFVHGWQLLSLFVNLSVIVLDIPRMLCVCTHINTNLFLSKLHLQHLWITSMALNRGRSCFLVQQHSHTCTHIYTHIQTEAMVINLRETHCPNKLFVQSNSSATQESFVLLESECDSIIFNRPKPCVLLLAPCQLLTGTSPTEQVSRQRTRQHCQPCLCILERQFKLVFKDNGI